MFEFYIMSMIKHQKQKKSVEMNRDLLDKLEQSIVQSINSLKDEIIDLKEIVINNLQDKNAILKVKWIFHTRISS